MAELLIELFSEEIPARMQARAADALQDAMTRSLADARLTAAEVETFVTPRRLVLVARDLPTAQPDLTEERKGPRVGAPDKAVQGFLRAAGLESLDQCETRSAPKGDFYVAIRQIPGRPAAEVLPGLIAEVILNLPWPKSMRWGRGAVRYVRPLHHVLAVFDGKALPGALDPGDAADPAATPGLVAAGTEGAIPFTDHSRGHRFLAPDPFPVRDFASYRTRLREGWVLLDRAERRQVIADDLARLAANEGLKVRPDDGLLDEVTGLVEWPVALIGRIDDQFMDLPPEVLATAMRSHQKYFTLVDDRDRMAPRFGVVANMVAEDGGAAIIAGNERVLRARLADARFFWDQDRKHPLDSRVGDLDALIFHARLGAMGEKVHRLQALAVALAPHVPGAELERVRSAARLAKADLVTGMVGEFPELQGIMGQYYARHDGNDPAVCAAVAEHYAPAGPADTCPTAPVSVAVALADKIDTLVGFFGIDEKPTGSKDPYALRRAALGVIRLVLENGLRLPLLEVFAEARDLYRRQCHLAEDTPDALLAFFADRLKVHLRDKGVRHDLIDAVFALGAQDDIALLLARVDALADFLATDDGANLLTAYRRASNIVGIEEKKDGVRYHGMPDGDAMREPEEHALRARLSEVAELADPALARAEYGVAMAALARLRKPLDDFFDRVTVNAEDPDLRANRLRLLSAIRTTMNRIADFSRIEG